MKDKPNANTIAKLLQTNPSRPWYKEGWVWFLLGVPGTSIVLSLMMLYVAISGRDTLVQDDYYKKGLAINESLQKDELALNLDLSARLEIEPDQTLKLRLSGSLPVKPEFLILYFEHPTLSNQDFDIRLIPNGDFYYGVLETSVAGKRYLTLSAYGSEWRLQTNAGFPTSEIIFSPKADRFTPS
jgi:hypothetical protein